MPIAARRLLQQRVSRQEGLQFPNRTHFERQQQPRRRSRTVYSSVHVRTLSLPVLRYAPHFFGTNS
jgi:hypothetical protein